LSHPKIDKVHNKHGNNGNSWDEHLVSPSDVEKVVADSEQYRALQREYGGEVGCKLVVWKSVQQSPSFNLFQISHHVSVAATRGRYDNVLVEGPRYEDNEHEEIDQGTHCAHSLGAASVSYTTRVIRSRTYISVCLSLHKSFPFNPIFMNALPSHRIKA
jgi:hypothetical protein